MTWIFFSISPRSWSSSGAARAAGGEPGVRPAWPLVVTLGFICVAFFMGFVLGSHEAVVPLPSPPAPPGCRWLLLDVEEGHQGNPPFQTDLDVGLPVAGRAKGGTMPDRIVCILNRIRVKGADVAKRSEG